MAPAAARPSANRAPTQGAVVAPLVLPACVSVLSVAGALWEACSALGLPDRQLEQLGDALERLLTAEADGSDAQRLERFRADYAPLRTWAARGRRDRAQRAMEVLLRHALGAG